MGMSKYNQAYEGGKKTYGTLTLVQDNKEEKRESESWWLDGGRLMVLPNTRLPNIPFWVFTFHHVGDVMTTRSTTATEGWTCIR